MDQDALDIAIKAFLRLMRERLDEAASLGRAADACAQSGNVANAVCIGNDAEQLLYEVTTLMNAASLINRIGRE